MLVYALAHHAYIPPFLPYIKCCSGDRTDTTALHRECEWKCAMITDSEFQRLSTHLDEYCEQRTISPVMRSLSAIRSVA